MSSEGIGIAIGMNYGFKGLEVDAARNAESSGRDKNGAVAGDKVSISIEAKALISQDSEKVREAGDTESKPLTADEERIRKIMQRIKEIQQELKELEEKEIPEKEKQQKRQALQSELMMLNSELSELMGNRKGTPIAGGTDAQGFSSSLT